MATIRGYHRPHSLDDALALLTRADTRSVVIGGGTTVNARTWAEPFEVVDLQALALNGITSENGAVHIGATAVLQDLVDSHAVPPLVGEAAKREAPNTIRNVATIGGNVAAGDPDSGLLASLLVHNATVEIAGPSGAAAHPLADLLAGQPSLDQRIITAVVIDSRGDSAWAGTARTPADTPIVAAYARSVGAEVRLALTGVAATPVLLDPAAVDSLQPLGDFRGSLEYRRALAAILTRRVLASLGAER